MEDVIPNHDTLGPDSRERRRHGHRPKRALEQFHQGNRATLQHYIDTADAYLMQIGEAKISDPFGSRQPLKVHQTGVGLIRSLATRATADCKIPMTQRERYEQIARKLDAIQTTGRAPKLAHERVQIDEPRLVP